MADENIAPANKPRSGRAAVFLDRDGTLIVEKNYLADPREAVLLDGVIEGLSRLQRHGLPLVIVSNQSGVGRGYFTMKEVEAVNARIDGLLKPAGIVIAGWYVCPHAPEAACRCRKPAPGLIEMASADLDLDPCQSYVIGDKRADLDLAKAVGARGILVMTGYGAGEAEHARAAGSPVCDSIIEASDLILGTRES